VVYAMVAEPARYGIEGERVTGVQMDVSPTMVLAQFRLFNPEVKRLGVLRSSTNTRFSVQQAIQTATQLGYEVVVGEVDSSRDVRRRFVDMRDDIDALWLLPDNLVISPINFHFLRYEALRARLPVLAYSRTLVEAGALMGLSPNPAQVGEQAAELTQAILSGASPHELAPRLPSQPMVVLNRDVQEALALELDPVLLDFVDLLIRQPSRR